MVMTLPGGTDWLYEITARFHVTSRFAGLSKQRSQNTPCCARGSLKGFQLDRP